MTVTTSLGRGGGGEGGWGCGRPYSSVLSCFFPPVGYPRGTCLCLIAFSTKILGFIILVMVLVIVTMIIFLALPESIGSLESLEYLNVFHNHIEVLVQRYFYVFKLLLYFFSPKFHPFFFYLQGTSNGTWQLKKTEIF